MNEPTWLTEQMVLAIHEGLICQYGGLSGVRDSVLLAASLARLQHKFSVQSEVSLWELAAAYGFALCQNHSFVDGNKRTAFMAMYVFLGLNAYSFNAPEPEIVLVMEGLASGEIDENALQVWLEKYGDELL
ncbi:type II toxin-antitoxin system death-on-curing family toxin [Nodularia spumigena]|uniref:Type II toxin-antitoxin system death-on-curing family toxin n=1 Tax=Nodularia spumigena UHCC 0060 TaxID=3110300 RepID=A0ABU5UMS8_NODSP|nr:type II toxin-antitoxin system death-on-curing family toxin [Nodularia spumigena]AHJ28005.1 Death on curing protein, Doc toxin [Nodularia spumigena CCY9414]EAW45694.1 death on curing protein-like protein [Nodularia spumigena CCY9414]MEA5527991.1 type II toxin-antitoxin system death-on-curing family toxin [Nodularia spumigena UHCC 0143]MEA5559522.1 type II toxin-antitoxin system death-on-curing family toxin [Nodularia spumigena CH309]MEA5607562.1 type II toxin-antitoxin system death-on-curin